MSDTLQRFIFKDQPVRGEWVQLDSSWREILERRAYPIIVQQALGEMVAASVLLAATVKMEGRLVLQIKSSGPVSLMMVECTSDHNVRALAQWDDAALNDDLDWQDLVGEGNLAITIETVAAKTPYQGIVSLEGESLAAVIEIYFQQSEQLETRLWLSADGDHAGGLLLQQLPGEADQDGDTWETSVQLAATVKDIELLELDVETLLYRLFNDYNVQLLTADDVNFACSCSTERVAATIRMLGRADIEALLVEHESVEVDCEFCNQHYHFDPVDVAEIFAENTITAAEDEAPILH
jgi:molecular chaperone Hsp33